MAAYTIEEIFNGDKYSVMSEVVKEILFSGPSQHHRAEKFDLACTETGQDQEWL